MDDKKFAFRDILKERWVFVKNIFLGHGVSLNNGGVIFEIIESWKNDYPITHQMEEEEIIKLYNMLLMSKQMFLILKKSEDEEARKIVELIEHSKKFLQNDKIK